MTAGAGPQVALPVVQNWIKRISGDGSIAVPSLILTVTGSGGVPFGPLATAPSSVTNGGVLTAVSGAPAYTAAGTTGQFIISQGSGAAIWATLSASNLSPLFTSSVSTAAAITFTASTAAQNSVLAGPSSGGTGAYTFRALVNADMPTSGAGSGTVTSVGLTDATGLFTVTGTPVTSSGSLDLSAYAAQAAGTVFANFSGSSGAPTWHSPGTADQVLGAAHTGGGLEYKTITGSGAISVTPTAGTLTISTTATGTVTSVAITGDGVLFNSTISGSPVTTSGTFNLNTSLLTQTANTFLAGPSSGAAATPTFRAIAPADLPVITVDLLTYSLYGGF